MPPPTREWLAAQYRDGRFDLPNAHYHALWDKEHEALANKLRHINASGEARLDRTTFTGLIQSRLPPNLSLTFAETVYRILAYHSTAPFYPPPSKPLPPSLSLADVQRGLAWLLPGRHLHMASMGTHGRTRTPADQRRLLFQSLATRGVAVAPDRPGPGDPEAVRRRHAHAHAHDVAHLRKHHGRWYDAADDAQMLADMAKANRDDDGDEMYHDLVDVLQRNAPANPPYGCGRDYVRPLARALRPDAVAFHTLAIPRAELAAFVGALVPLQFETPPPPPGGCSRTPVDPALFSEAVARALAAFACDDDDDDDAALAAAYPAGPNLVAWPAFDRALQRIPRLLGPVYRLLVDILLDGVGIDVDDYPGQEAPPELLRGPAVPPRVLSLGRMALAHAILPPSADCVDYVSLRTVLLWRRPLAPDAAAAPASGLRAVWERVRPRARAEYEEPVASIVAFSGRVRGSGAPFVGGVLAAADYDGDDGRARVYSLYPFQVVPVPRYAKFLGQEWRQDGGNLVLGETVTSGLRDGKGALEFELPAFLGCSTIELEALEVWCNTE